MSRRQRLASDEHSDFNMPALVVNCSIAAAMWVGIITVVRWVLA